MLRPYNLFLFKDFGALQDIYYCSTSLLEAALRMEHEGEEVELFVRSHGAGAGEVINDARKEIDIQQSALIDVEFIHEEAAVTPKWLVEE